MAHPTALPPIAPPTCMTSPSRPKLELPRGSCDAHFHIFGPGARFPYASGRASTPSDAPKEDLFALHKLLGIEHGVVVQTQAHGHDNSVTAAALAATLVDGGMSVRCD
jgi:2-pyrone-4,6-dicarboxylate lactonase